jgi:FdhE protein
MVGRALPPPFVRLPDPATLFARRAERFAALAADHPLRPYLELMEGIARAQDAILPSLAPVSSLRRVSSPAARSAGKGIQTSSAESLDSLPLRGSAAPAGDDTVGEVPPSSMQGLPPLNRLAWRRDATVHETLHALFDTLGSVAMPGEAAEALSRLKRAKPAQLGEPIAAVLAEAIPAERLAEHAFVAAGLQVHAARAAATLRASDVTRIAYGLCPCCGGAPVASLIVGWPGAENARYVACSLCGTLWNEVRVKCLVCEATGGIGYREVEGGDGAVKAECCDTCHSYVKVMHQARHPGLDPVADDIASVGLDMLLNDEPYRRASFNPFLLGV